MYSLTSKRYSRKYLPERFQQEIFDWLPFSPHATFVFLKVCNENHVPCIIFRINRLRAQKMQHLEHEELLTSNTTLRNVLAFPMLHWIVSTETRLEADAVLTHITNANSYHHSEHRGMKQTHTHTQRKIHKLASWEEILHGIWKTISLWKVFSPPRAMSTESLRPVQFHSSKNTGAGDHFPLQGGGLPDPRICPDPKIKHRSLAVSELQADSLPLSHLRSPHLGPVNISTLDDNMKT